MNEMRLRYNSDPGPGEGKLYKAEVQSQFGWGMVGHYDTVDQFEKLYPHLHKHDQSDSDKALDIHTYFDEETGFTYRVRPIIFLRDTNR